MKHTLVAVFEDRSDAQNAMDELLAAGFSRDEVRVSNADPTGMTSSMTGREGDNDGRTTEDNSFGASIKHFFTDLFGSDNNEHAQRYEGAVTRGHHVLTVNADSEPEVERAADIIERFGPTDIDEHADQAGSGAMRMGSGSAMGQSAGLSAQSADDSPLYQQPIDADRPHHTTYQESQGQSGLSATGETALPGAAMQGGSLSGSRQDAGSQGGSQQRDTSIGQGGSQQRDTSTSQKIPVVQEQVKVGKREFTSGGVRVFSRVVETPVNESIDLREEHVHVERHSVNEPVSTKDKDLFKEQTIEMRETTEEAVVEKSARVVEEVVIGKEVNQRQEQIKDTVRRTEVEIEQLGRDSARSNMTDDDEYYRRHWQSNYGAQGGSYDDYAPAYSYGSEMARSQRGRSWDESENELRSGWERRQSSSGRGDDRSTWDKMKDAVRHGWDSMTGDDNDNDEAYRRHHSSTYGAAEGDYDDYRPAYSYGEEMGRSQYYRGRPWNDVEPQLRTNWEQSRSGSTDDRSSWDKVKDAVRQGWERVSKDSESDEDSYYRNHWSSTYGSGAGSTYEAYRPAYAYGAQMARSDLYSGRNWDDAEPELRRGWEQSAGTDQSSWDKVKEAVRHGWDRMTS